MLFVHKQLYIDLYTYVVSKKNRKKDWKIEKVTTQSYLTILCIRKPLYKAIMYM